MRRVTSARGQNTRRGGSDPVVCGFKPPTFRGVAPARPEPLGAVFCPRAEIGANSL